MRNILNYYCVILIILFTSCASLKPIDHNDKLQELTPININILDGNYEIYPTEHSFRTLEYITTYNDFYNFIRFPQHGDYINLKAIDKTRIKVTVYHNNSIIKTRIIKGKIKQNYFDYKIRSLSFYFLINTYGDQNNRIGVLKNGDLTIDAINAGCILLVFLPCACGGAENYNFIFKRRIGSS